jgi:hypothetical protein
LTASHASRLVCYNTREIDGATDRSLGMKINWADIAWLPIAILAAFVFVASVVGNSLTRNAFVGAIIAVILFIAFYVFWVYYPDLPFLKQYPVR